MKNSLLSLFSVAAILALGTNALAIDVNGVSQAIERCQSKNGKVTLTVGENSGKLQAVLMEDITPSKTLVTTADVEATAKGGYAGGDLQISFKSNRTRASVRVLDSSSLNGAPKVKKVISGLICSASALN